MDWLLSAGEGGTRRGCWEATEVGGKCGGRIFSAINCSLILLIRTRLSSWWREGKRRQQRGGSGAEEPAPAASPWSIPHVHLSSVFPKTPLSWCQGGGVLPGWAWWGGGRPEVGVVEARLRHPAGREGGWVRGWHQPPQRHPPASPWGSNPTDTTILPKSNTQALKEGREQAGSRQGQGTSQASSQLKIPAGSG